MSRLKKNINWALIFLYAFFTIYVDASNNQMGGLSSILLVSTLVLFAIIHGTTFYRLKDFITFLVLSVVISNIYENIGVMTGFPFGSYHYTDNIGPKLFYVPIIIGFSYFSVGYLSWMIAHTLLGTYRYVPERWNILAIPVIASFIMVSWDVVIDPLSSTLSHDWIWHKGGPYFGVPFVNFMGWCLVVFTYNQSFALYLSKGVQKAPKAQPALPKVFWYQAAIMYGVIALEYPFLSLIGENVQILDQTGKPWWTGDMYQTAALISLFPMIFIAVLSLIRVAQDSTPKK